MEEKDDAFLAKLLATFKIEAEEHLKNLNDGMLALEKTASKDVPQDLLETIFREAHSLKGAARSVSLDQIQLLCQAMENVLSDLRQRRIAVSKEMFDALYAANDLIAQLLDNGQKVSKNSLVAIVQKLDSLLTEPVQPFLSKSDSDLSIANKAPDSSNAADFAQVAPGADETSDPKESETKPQINPNEASNDEEQNKVIEQNEPIQQVGDKTIRVSLSKLDRLFQQTEELLTVKLTSQQQLNDLKLIEKLLGRWSKEAIRWEGEAVRSLEKSSVNEKNKRIAFFNAHREFIKSFKDILSRLIKSTSQDYRLLGGIIDSLLDDTKKLLMQPFGNLLETFPRLVRDLCRQLGKEAQLDIQGADIEIDRRILEELKDPFTHIIRNSLDHGIESPAERIKKNKPTIGTIKVSVSQLSSNSVEIIIADDGQGINVQAVKQSAIKNKIISPKDAEALTEQEAIMLIFQSGISTSRIVTELSGRGLGMGILLEKVDKLGGQLTVDSKTTGTTFRLILPLTLATFRGIQLQIGKRMFIMPTHSVRRVVRMPLDAIKTVENRSTITIDGKALSFVHLKDILGLSTENDENQEWVTVLITKAAEQVVALGADAVLNEQEVLVKRFGKQLTRVKNILSATVMEMGKVIPILNPSDIVKSILSDKYVARNNNFLQPESDLQASKRILLVEDSVTTRMLLKNILEAAGYDVTVAVDGLEAFNILKEKKVDLLLTDIEMPNMNGFTLTENVRKTESLKDLPIVLCTSLSSQQDREHGIEVGANAYLDKSSFTQSHLLDVIEKLL